MKRKELISWVLTVLSFVLIFVLVFLFRGPVVVIGQRLVMFTSVILFIVSLFHSLSIRYL